MDGAGCRPGIDGAGVARAELPAPRIASTGVAGTGWLGGCRGGDGIACAKMAGKEMTRKAYMS